MDMEPGAGRGRTLERAPLTHSCAEPQVQGAGVFSFGEGFGEWLVVPVLASVVPAVGGSSICISNDPLEV